MYHIVCLLPDGSRSVVGSFAKKADAVQALMGQARNTDNPEWIYFDSNDRRVLTRDGVDCSWYRGAGLYEDCKPILLKGGTSYSTPTCTYKVERADA